MEQALRDSEARLAAFMENAPVGMYLKDVQGHYTLTNPEMSKVFARPAQEMLGLTAGDTLAGHDLDGVMRRDREVLESGRVVVVEEHTPALDAYSWSMVIRFPIRSGDGKITHIGGFHVDITERKAMEEALKASEQQFRMLAEAHPVPLFIVRLEDGGIMVATPPCETLLKLPLNELLGSSMLRFCADPQSRAKVDERNEQEGSLNGLEVLFRRADGGEFWGSLTSRLLTFEGERAMVTAIVDLTESKRIEAELDRQSALLHQNEKLSALGSLLAGVAHELNNPLSLVVGYAGLLEEMAPDDATKERAVKVRIAADRCARIVRTFLAMARNKPRAPVSVQLNEVAEAALEIVAYGLRTADIQVERCLAADLPPVHGDADQLHQVLANLLVNAQQALQTVPPPRRLRISSGEDGEAVWVQVTDNGPGIPATIVSRIFEPFFTTKPQGVGTGVGLSVSHGITLY
jgi:PAS domain S-box-containing protein